MKKYFTFLALTLFSIKAFAQDTIPNPSFERWTVDTTATLSTYPNPVGWSTPNQYTDLAGVVVVTQSSDPYLGTYAAQLETQSIEGGVYSAPGALLLGNLNIDFSNFSGSITGGVPFTARPDSLYGYYQYTPASGKTDSCLAFLYLSHWNTINNKRDTLAAGIFESGVTTTLTNYAKFSIPIVYDSLYKSELPDTLQLGILSSYRFLSNPPAGTTMLVDDITFSADTLITTGINTLANKGFGISCYPNPANANLNILISEPSPGMSIKVYDVLGRNLLVANNQGLITPINVSNLSTGSYFFEVLDTNGNLLKTEKFSVVR